MDKATGFTMVTRTNDYIMLGLNFTRNMSIYSDYFTGIKRVDKYCYTKLLKAVMHHWIIRFEQRKIIAESCIFICNYAMGQIAYPGRFAPMCGRRFTPRHIFFLKKSSKEKWLAKLSISIDTLLQKNILLLHDLAISIDILFTKKYDLMTAPEKLHQKGYKIGQLWLIWFQ